MLWTSHIVLAVGVALLGVTIAYYTHLIHDRNNQLQRESAIVDRIADRIPSGANAVQVQQVVDRCDHQPSIVIIYKPTTLRPVRLSPLDSSAFLIPVELIDAGGVAPETVDHLWSTPSAPMAWSTRNDNGVSIIERPTSPPVTVGDIAVLAALIALGIGFVVTACLHASRRVTRPIHDLADAAYRGALGQAVDTVPKRGLREVDLLWHTVGEAMAADHLSAQAELARQNHRHVLIQQMSHDLRGPADLVTFQIERLSQMGAECTPETAGARESQFDLLRQHMARLDAKIASVVANAQAELADEAEVVDLALLAGQRLDDLASVIEFSGTRCTTDLAPGVRARARPLAVGAVIGELVTNALRHARGGAVVVTLSSDTAGGTAVLTVSDSGPGIPEAEREAVLRPGGRASEGRSGGFGLGLYLANETISQLGGGLYLGTSKLGGLEVQIRLPLADAIHRSWLGVAASPGSRTSGAVTPEHSGRPDPSQSEA